MSDVPALRIPTIPPPVRRSVPGRDATRARANGCHSTDTSGSSASWIAPTSSSRTRLASARPFASTIRRTQRVEGALLALDVSLIAYQDAGLPVMLAQDLVSTLAILLM